MPKHTYIVTVNRIPASREPVEYKFRQTRCTLTCSKDAASVRFEMGVLRRHEDLISFRVDLVKDAMRKMYLLHAMRFDTRLRVRSIHVSIDSETVVYEQGYPGFPFLYSMLTARSLGLPESWRDPAFLAAVLSATKSASDNDHRYACLFSFLAGTGKAYESERFTCYWTALNALYNHLQERAEPFQARSLGYASFADIPSKKRPRSTDASKLLLLMRLYGCGDTFSSQPDRMTKFRSQYGAIKTLLRTVPRPELPELYRQLREHRTDRTWFPDGPLGEHLLLCCTRTDCSAWGFLLFDYAYYIRCNYLHGDKTTILFTAESDPELAAFRALNVFLGEFLREVIPELFRDDCFTAQRFEALFPPAL